MVPTEVLALQHYETMNRMLSGLDIRIRLLHGSMSSKMRRSTVFDIQNNIAQIVIGTHAIFSRDVEYDNLGLVIIDEQHKFGIRERINLVQKGNNPHVLIMTATPLPRTLSLLKYGDLDHSIIPDRPIKENKTKTKVLYKSKRLQAWSFIKDEIEKGNQAYFVYPRIEDKKEGYSGTLENIEASYKDIMKFFHPHPIIYLHGRMAHEEKNDVLFAFSRGDIKILVSTSVIEVGIDVEKANLMIIENAENFGLTSLHQLRGRIGRKGEDAYCFLITHKDITDSGKDRLRAMVKSKDGFSLAESDLEIRGPGDYIGIRQSGWVKMQWNDPSTDKSFLDSLQKKIEDWKKENINLLNEYMENINKHSLYYFEQKPFISN